MVESNKLLLVACKTDQLCYCRLLRGSRLVAAQEWLNPCSKVACPFTYEFNPKLNKDMYVLSK